MQVDYKCDVGKARQLNEDSVLCLMFDVEFGADRQSAGLFIVADGMGGHNAGEIASEWGVKMVARECLPRLLCIQAESSGQAGSHTLADDPQAVLVKAVNVANLSLFKKARGKQALQGMGTTITAALIIGQDMYVAHLGDSRCYIINSRETIQVTKDHSEVQELVDAGLITQEQSMTHPNKNVITRVLGYYHDAAVDSYHLKLYRDDNVLLCSDGLWEVLTERAITEIVLASPGPEQACLELVTQANNLGGPDNISVIIARPENLPSWQELVNMDTQIMRKHQ
jgi:serine/threonine protein phosphatase PrpC